MRYAFIRDHREAFPVGLMCRTLEVGRSGLYAWLNRSESLRSQENRRLLMEIKVAHQKSRKAYGSPRIYAELNENGYACGRHRVARLMRQHGIVSKHKRKFKVTTNSAHAYPVAENLLQRKFAVSASAPCTNTLEANWIIIILARTSIIGKAERSCGSKLCAVHQICFVR